MSLYGKNIPLKGMELGKEAIKALARNNGVMVRTGERRIYSEPINFAGKVLIFGGGHVAQELIHGDYDAPEEKITVGSRDYIVIVTHAYDAAVLRQVITRDCAYIGVIGSKAKIAALKGRLISEGISEKTLNKMNAPIGLNIRSETPEEIAVSIAGEMILRRAERRAAAQEKDV